MNYNLRQNNLFKVQSEGCYFGFQPIYLPIRIYNYTYNFWSLSRYIPHNKNGGSIFGIRYTNYYYSCRIFCAYIEIRYKKAIIIMRNENLEWGSDMIFLRLVVWLSGHAQFGYNFTWKQLCTYIHIYIYRYYILYFG